MLVLTRRKQESVLLGQDIVITVLEIRGDQVRLGISAPRDVPVFRQELLVDTSAETPADEPGDSPPDTGTTPAEPAGSHRGPNGRDTA